MFCVDIEENRGKIKGKRSSTHHHISVYLIHWSIQPLWLQKSTDNLNLYIGLLTRWLDCRIINQRKTCAYACSDISSIRISVFYIVVMMNVYRLASPFSQHTVVIIIVQQVIYDHRHNYNQIRSGLRLHSYRFCHTELVWY